MDREIWISSKSYFFNLRIHYKELFY